MKWFMQNINLYKIRLLELILPCLPGFSFCKCLLSSYGLKHGQTQYGCQNDQSILRFFFLVTRTLNFNFKTKTTAVAKNMWNLSKWSSKETMPHRNRHAHYDFILYYIVRHIQPFDLVQNINQVNHPQFQQLGYFPCFALMSVFQERYPRLLFSTWILLTHYDTSDHNNSLLVRLWVCRYYYCYYYYYYY